MAIFPHWSYWSFFKNDTDMIKFSHKVAWSYENVKSRKTIRFHQIRLGNNGPSKFVPLYSTNLAYFAMPKAIKKVTFISQLFLS